MIRIHLNKLRSVIVVNGRSFFVVLPLLASIWANSFAQTNSQPIRLVVPLPAGGGTDYWARLASERMAVTLGRRIVVENKPGAGTMIGAENVARAAPDGQTILVGAVGTFSLNPHLYPKISYDVYKDFAPVSMTARHTLALFVPQSSPLHSYADFLSAGRRRPDGLLYGSAGTASPHHLAMEVISEAGGLKMTHVPYKGAAALATDLAGGQIEVAFLEFASALSHMKSGRLRPLAVFSSARLGSFPEIPTIGESGMNVPIVDAWQGMVVPAHTPTPIITRMNAAYRTAAQDPTFVNKMNEVGILIAPSTPEDFWLHVKRESERWKKLINDKKITAE